MQSTEVKARSNINSLRKKNKQKSNLHAISAAQNDSSPLAANQAREESSPGKENNR
jgi:hypothetical protein